MAPTSLGVRGDGDEIGAGLSERTGPKFIAQATSAKLNICKPIIQYFLINPASIVRRTSEAISMRKSWKPSDCDESSGLQRLVGDFVSEDHLLLDLMVNHRVQSL